jgi:hypothetical protein
LCFLWEDFRLAFVGKRCWVKDVARGLLGKCLEQMSFVIFDGTLLISMTERLTLASQAIGCYTNVRTFTE